MKAAESGSELVVDVAVVGGGLAGLATAIHLARKRRRVLCVEPRPWPRPAVGESLEFSAPQLLDAIGIDLEAGAERRQLFPKTAVRIVGNEEDFTVWPPGWFRRPPIWCSRLAFHVDRTELDRQLLALAVDSGVQILPERVTKVDHDHDGIIAVRTDRMTRVGASWFVDATGHTCRLIGRALGLGREPLGRPRAAIWSRISEPPDGHATNLYFPEPDADDLMWAWEIPLNDREVSVGLVMDAATLRARRSVGSRPREIFEQQLGEIPRLGDLVGEHPGSRLHTTTYVPYRHRRPIGPNWVLVGDASAMVDPLTSNGVTSALRHAALAASVVADALDRGGLSRRNAWTYRHTAPATITTLDHAIETFLYQPAVRQALGLRWAVNLYAATGVITNSLYAKLSPNTGWRSLASAVVLSGSRVWITVARRVLARLPRRERPGRPARDHARSGHPGDEGRRHAARIRARERSHRC